MNIFLIFICFFAGHYISALILYSFHRFVFHGKLRRYPVFKYLAKLHGLHHANIAQNLDKYIFIPWWISLLLIILIVSFSYLNLGFGLGIASFALLYAHRHWAIHHHDFSSKFFLHHDYHHRENVLKNFSGVYPIFDKIFGTYVVTAKRKDND